MGLVPLLAGTITLDQEDLVNLPAHEVPRRRIAYVPQGRRLFSELTVTQNLDIGLMVRGSGDATKERVLALFPRLRERLKQRAESLSGGEQQMLAMARALCIEPRVLLLDEPTEGLQPSMIKLIRDVILQMQQENVAIILVEQRVDAVISLADRIAFIEHGRNPETLTATDLQTTPSKLRQYLGVGPP